MGAPAKGSLVAAPRKSVGSFLIPAFAGLWLAMIYASLLFGHTYKAPFTATASAFEASPTVLSAAPELQALGIVPGARLAMGTLTFSQKMRLNYGTENSVAEVPLIENGAVRLVPVQNTREIAASSALQNILDATVLTFALLLTAYLGYRRPSPMILAITLFIGGGGLSWPHFTVLLNGLPDFLFAPIVWVLRDLCNIFPVLVLASFAIRLPGTSPSRERRIAIWIVDAIVLAGFAIDGWPEHIAGLYRGFVAAWAIVLLVASLLSLRFAQPADRSRVGIVFASIMVGGVGYAISMIAVSLGIISGHVFYAYVDMSIILIPLAVTYAILKHRVFDLNFVLNRTIVYAVTSAVLLCVVAAFEFFAERYLSALTHAESIVVDFIATLIVIVSARFVHGRVDRAVDAVLFRPRHEQEAALRRFATTVQFYTSQAPLIRDTLDALERYGRVQGAAVYLTGGGALERAASSWASSPGEIEENDPVYVEMRAHEESLDLHERQTALPGVRVYPMILAGRLVGLLCVGDRESGEAMPPDIDAAIQRIAQAAAIATAAIETDAIRQENALLQQRLSSLAPVG